MDIVWIAVAAAGCAAGAFTVWLIMRNHIQSRLFSLQQTLAEQRQSAEFAGRERDALAQELADSRADFRALQEAFQDLNSRFAAAENQLDYLQEQEIRAGRLKEEYERLQYRAHELEVANSRLAALTEQEKQAAAEKQESARQTQAKLEAELRESRSHTQDLQADLADLGNRFAAAGKQIAYLQEKEEEAGRLKEEAEQMRREMQQVRVDNERLNTRMEQERLAAADKLALLEEARQSLGDQFQNLANSILEEKSRRFTEQNHEHLNRLLTPLNERIQGFDALVRQTYEKESRERLTLENELKRLQELNGRLHSDAKALTDALTGTQNKAQGNWGEMILESVLEHSGLQKGREYIVQAASTRQEEDGAARRLQPDVLVNLPDNKQIVIDSKVSLTAYVRYTQAADKQTAERELAAHTASIRSHVRNLARKNYSDLDGLNTLDFVFMFVPVEPAYLLALQYDADLFQECFDKRIMLVGPGTLLATLRTVANIWRNEQQNQNALAIADEGGRLYDKFVGFVQTLEGVGKHLDQAQTAFQTAFGQLSTGRGNLVGRAEKLRLMGVRANKQLQRDLLEQSGLSSGIPDKGQTDGTEISSLIP